MPYKLEKQGTKYFVTDDKGKRYSDKPSPKWRALRQMRALYAAENKKATKNFRVFKQSDGSYRWVTISSSAFRDRDGEIVTAKALEDAVNRMDTSGYHGPLRWWHIGSWEYPDGPEAWQSWRAGKGIDLGSCDFSMVHGKVLLESGTFKDAVTGEAFAQAGANLEVSIAFSHPATEPDGRKEYHTINIFERSLLPAGMASNLLTKLYVNKGEDTMKAAQKLQALAAILRNKPDVVKQILEDAESVEKAAEVAGLEYKEVTDLLSGESQPETEAETPPVETEVIPTPEPAAEPAQDAPIAEAAKQAPEAEVEIEEPEEDVIGDWSSQKLASFIAQTVKAVLEAQSGGKEEKEHIIEQSQVDLIAAMKAMNGRLMAVEESATKNQQSLFELADARPAGVKQLQSVRATERNDNIVKQAPTGPQIDPDFLRFAQGGK